MDDKNDMYNLPLASFTFGREGTKPSMSKGNIYVLKSKVPEKPNLNNKNLNTSLKKKNIKQINHLENNNQIDMNNYYYENYVSQNNASTKEEICELTFGGNNELIKEEYEPNMNKNQNNVKKNNSNYISSFINNGGINDSFICVILYSIHHMKLFRKYIVNDLNNAQNKNYSIYQNSFLYHLREILIQIGKNKYIDIHNFREYLSKQFQNCRKFLADQPDDPADLLFVIINAIHSYSIQFSLNEISDETCIEKCFSHKFIWLDLARIDECKCKGITKRLFSNHNYITDIPIKKIFNLMDNNNNKNNENILFESNQKLFNYYTNLISGIKTNCPINGQRCPINKTSHKLHLANSPSYLIFNIEHELNEIEGNYAYPIMNILKSFILIPNKFDIWTLFELNSKKNKNDFDFMGCILFKISKIYSCAFKNKKGLITYYECDNENININRGDDNNNNIIEFVSYFDFVFFCIKNGLIPVMLFYQGTFLSRKYNNNNINNNMDNYNDFLSNEQISILEKFCVNTDNLYKILQNNLRKKEYLIFHKKIKTSNIVSSKPNNNKSTIIDDYFCFNCQNKNPITDKICSKCGYNNNDFLLNNNFNKNKKSNNLTHINNNSNISKNNNYSQGKQNLNSSLINKNANSQDVKGYNNDHMIIQLSKRKKMSVSPDIKHKDNIKILENYNFETYQNKNNVKYMDLPIPYMPIKKENQSININNNNKKYNLNKTEIDINNNNNNKNNIIISNDKKLHASPKLFKNNNISIKNNNSSNHKKILSINSKNKIPLNNSKDNHTTNNNNHNTSNKYEKNNSTKKMKIITRTLTSNKEMANRSYLNSESNPVIFRNKNDNNKVNLNKKKNKKIDKNNLYTDADIMETEVNDFNKSKRKNFDLNNLYVNGNIRNNNHIYNSNYMNYSYNDILFDKRKSSKHIHENNNNKNYQYNKGTFNKKKNNLNMKLNTWKCNNCSHINSDDYIYCKICKKNKDGEILRVKTPINDKKIKIKINKSNNSFVKNINTEDNNGYFMKEGFTYGFNSTKEFRKNQLNKKNNNNNNNKNTLNQNKNIGQNQDKNSMKKIYNNTRGNIYRTYNIE